MGSRYVVAATVCFALGAGCGAAPDAQTEQTDRAAPSITHAVAPGNTDGLATAVDPGNVDDPGYEGSGDVDAGAPPTDAGAPSPDATPPAETGAPSSGRGYELLAKEAIRELSAMSSSTYDHTTSVDEAKGIFDYDCSGFLGYAFDRAVPDAIAAVRAASVVRPLAKDYEGFIESIAPGASSGRWHRVARAVDLVPGDVVAWLKPAVVTSSNTGHVMIVRGAPTVSASRPDEILVPITDSTSTPHGPSDSRTPGATTGLGTGTIGLLVDATGAPWGYHWSGGYSRTEYSTSITLGHVE